MISRCSPNQKNIQVLSSALERILKERPKLLKKMRQQLGQDQKGLSSSSLVRFLLRLDLLVAATVLIYFIRLILKIRSH